MAKNSGLGKGLDALFSESKVLKEHLFTTNKNNIIMFLVRR